MELNDTGGHYAMSVQSRDKYTRDQKKRNIHYAVTVFCLIVTVVAVVKYAEDLANKSSAVKVETG